MFSIFYYAFNAIAPIILLPGIGYYCRQKGILDAASLRKMNRFNFKFCFFAMMFHNIYTAESVGSFSPMLVTVVMGAMALITVIGWLVARWATKDPAARGVMIQAGFRSNYAILGLSVVSSLVGPEAMGLASIFQIPVVIYFNIVSVYVLSVFRDSDERVSLTEIVKDILTNPMVLGLLAGLASMGVRLFLPLRADGSYIFTIERDLPWLYQVITYLSRCATPIALVVLGGQLEFSAVKELGRELVAGIFQKLVIAPAVGFAVLILADRAGLITLGRDVAAMAVAIYASPAAVASAVMAQEMKGDARLAGQLVVWGSVVGMPTMFTIIFLLRYVGIL